MRRCDEYELNKPWKLLHKLRVSQKLIGIPKPKLNEEHLGRDHNCQRQEEQPERLHHTKFRIQTHMQRSDNLRQSSQFVSLQ